MTAGKEEGAKEEACKAVDGWITANKLHNALRNEDSVWEALMRNVFPDAPEPTQQITHRQWFKEMCNR